tara:strand:+ start:244 stop:468 length:225 start_codon:yes stop_codon:yes gene_type:complete
MRNALIDAVRSHLEGCIKKHVVNVEVYLNNSVGIGEHSDITESIETELGHISEYHDKLEALERYFKQPSKKSPY